MRILAKTYEGLEDIAAEEIERIGGSKIQKLKRAVMYDGSRYTLYASNMFLRTVTRIIVPVLETRIGDEEDLYNKVKGFPWEEYFGIDQTFAVHATTSSSVFRHSKYLALKSKDGIVDRFREKLGSRPNVDTDNPDFAINIHVRRNIMTISLDATGKSLHIRGYRKNKVEAPLAENLAASLIYLSEWDKKMPFLDPMCGSGTLLGEAYMISRGIPPHTVEEDFSCKLWKDYNEKLYNRSWEEEKSKLEVSTPLILGRDISRESISASRQNMEILGAKEINLTKEDFFLSEKPCEKGLMIINPPYDVRLKNHDINEFYSRIGDTLKQRYAGWRACIVSANEEAVKSIGLRTSMTYNIMNGPLSAKFVIFDIYEGKKQRY